MNRWFITVAEGTCLFLRRVPVVVKDTATPYSTFVSAFCSNIATANRAASHQ